MAPGEALVTVKLPELPTGMEHLLSHYQYTQIPIKNAPNFDILWQAQNSQEHRLGQIGMIPLVSPDVKDVLATAGPGGMSRGRLRAILRVTIPGSCIVFDDADGQMIVATPAAQYDQAAAIKLLKDYDQPTVVNPEITAMVNEKILVKHFSASLTGRFYSFAQT